ncbi:MAG: minor capsid protein [Cetobacterium sp.]
MNKKVLTNLKESEKRIDKEIASLYGKFGKDNMLDSKEAKRYLDKSEFKEWRANLHDMMAEFKTSKNAKLWDEIEVLSMKSRINRLESFKAQIRAETLRCGALNDKVISDGLAETYKNAYNKTTYNTQIGNGLLWDFAEVDADKMRDVLMFKNSGKNFSERVYENTTRIATRINKDISQAFISSFDYKRVARDIKKDFKISTSESIRLVRTETNFYMNQASLKSYIDSDIEKYIYEATLDKRTSTQCQILDQKVIDVKDAVAGNNYPPLHPNCRSTTVASFETSYKERVGRNKENVNVIVSGDLKYEDWTKYIEIGKLPKIAKIEIKPLVVESNVEESIKALESKNWNIKTEKLYKEMNEDIAKENIIELDRLTTLYKKVTTFSNDAGKDKFDLDTMRDRGTYAHCTSRYFNKKQTIKFNGEYFQSNEMLIKSNKQEAEVKFKMPYHEKTANIYTMRHEFGHMIQNCISREDRKNNKKKWDELEGLFKEVRTKREADSVMAKINRQEKNIAKAHALRIDEIARELKIKDGLNSDDYLSRYGKTNDFETFAECFANSQEEKPNIYGRAMLQFLKERGVENE